MVDSMFCWSHYNAGHSSHLVDLLWVVYSMMTDCELLIFLWNFQKLSCMPTVCQLCIFKMLFIIAKYACIILIVCIDSSIIAKST